MLLPTLLFLQVAEEYSQAQEFKMVLLKAIHTRINKQPPLIFPMLFTWHLGTKPPVSFQKRCSKYWGEKRLFESILFLKDVAMHQTHGTDGRLSNTTRRGGGKKEEMAELVEKKRPPLSSLISHFLCLKWDATFPFGNTALLANWLEEWSFKHSPAQHRGVEVYRGTNISSCSSGLPYWEAAVILSPSPAVPAPQSRSQIGETWCMTPHHPLVSRQTLPAVGELPWNRTKALQLFTSIECTRKTRLASLEASEAQFPTPLKPPNTAAQLICVYVTLAVFLWHLHHQTEDDAVQFPYL